MSVSSQISLVSINHACDTLLANQKIRYICVIDKIGHLIFEKNQKEECLSLPDEKSRSLFVQSVLDVVLKKDFDEQFSLLKYNVSYRNKTSIITVPIFGHVVFLSVDSHENCELIAQTVIKIFEIIFKNYQYAA